MKNTIHATRITAEQLKAEPTREYNPTEWERTVNRYLKFKNVEFFKADKGEGFEYDRYYVIYTLPEGLRLMGEVSYSSSLTNGGFRMATVCEFILKPDSTVEMLPSGAVQIMFTDMQCEGKPVRIGTTPEARQWMIERSERYGAVYTKL